MDLCTFPRASLDTASLEPPVSLARGVPEEGGALRVGRPGPWHHRQPGAHSCSVMKQQPLCTVPALMSELKTQDGRGCREVSDSHGSSREPAPGPEEGERRVRRLWAQKWLRLEGVQGGWEGVLSSARACLLGTVQGAPLG